MHRTQKHVNVKIAPKKELKMKCEYCKNEYHKNTASKQCSLKCRLMIRIEKKGECWEWNRYVGERGYALLSYQGKMHNAHRLSYQIFKGNIPENLFVCHTCDNRKCINPDHLWLGTRRENIQDASKKGRLPGGPGHKPSPDVIEKLLKSRKPFPNGEQHPTSKLKKEDIIHIRKLLDEGIKQTDIAKKFNVCSGVISQIKHKRTWSHV